MSDDETVREAYRDFKNGKLAEAIQRYASTEDERKTLIQALIRRREHQCDADLRRLKIQATVLLRKLETNRHEHLAAEIACFKDVMALHHLLLDHGPRRR